MTIPWLKNPNLKSGNTFTSEPKVFFVAHKVKNPNWPEENQLAILQMWLKSWTRNCWEQIQLAVREEIELGDSALQSQRSINRSTMLPPQL